MLTALRVDTTHGLVMPAAFPREETIFDWTCALHERRYRPGQ